MMELHWRIMMEAVEKLPKWAQNKIKVLEMRLSEMTKRATAWESQKPTMVSVRGELPNMQKQLKCPKPRSWKLSGHLVGCFGPKDPTHTGKPLRHYEGVATVASQKKRIAVLNIRKKANR